MKLKRPILALVLIVLIGCFALTPLLASASVTVANGSFEVLPGNPQSSSPAYSKAWLDTVIIRDGSTAITACASPGMALSAAPPVKDDSA